MPRPAPGRSRPTAATTESRCSPTPAPTDGPPSLRQGEQYQEEHEKPVRQIDRIAPILHLKWGAVFIAHRVITPKGKTKRSGDCGATARLVIAGRGWWENEVRDEVERLGLGDVVDLVGYVSETERHRLLASSWVSLVPSVKEGWGLVVVEAGMHATPTIAFRGTGGITESIVDGQTGYLAAPDDVGDLTELTRRLLLDGAFCLGSGTLGRAATPGLRARLQSRSRRGDAPVPPGARRKSG